ncbi:PepSY-associated TM helix domain-containing protein [Vibrio hibernica]|uniref:PepSY-associated TM helix domain-containing protein n=1 Tax=Vibrio hibernica TaxID=2587465 RepID=UPI001881DEF5|nr:PepSY-associated TM helix domain-containing protein [Vibrio hibernica]
MTVNDINPYRGVSAFIKRLHFYIGLFIGPFIFMAALTGTLYVLTPQIEQAIYHQELTTTSHGEPQALSAQIAAARHSLPEPLMIKSVRPAPAVGETTRVLFTDPTLDRARLRTVFVDPVTLEIKGELASYGTSGVLPLRIAIDFLHTDLLLGPVGRYYSELAASWMWIAALGGIFLWWQQRRSFNNKSKSGSYAQYRSRHAKVAIWISLGLIFFSATGLTWSKWAGGNISQWRNSIGWVTPSVSRQLPINMGSKAANTASKAVDIKDSEFDGVLAAARQSGIDAGKIEIVPSYKNNTAWLVSEVDRSWPTQVDSVSVEPISMTVIDHAEFKNFSIVAKLIRWGIDAHMGVLFGWPNQLILAVFGISLCTVIAWGYVIWWKRRPMAANTNETLVEAWLALAPLAKVLVIVFAVIFGYALPLMGCSLLLCCVIDVIRWRLVAYRSQQLA